MRTTTQNHSKMKTKTNIALEGTRSGDVVGGLLLWTVENLRALLFGKDKLSGLSWMNKKSPWFRENQGQRWAVQLMTGTAKKWISQRGFGFYKHNATM